MKRSTVQIIIPVYNCEKTINKCIDSVLKQTFSDWQVLLVDDCSTDNSKQIIDDYIKKDSRFFYYKNDKNSGASTTRNNALDKVESEYVAFLDSDDFWEEDMLKTLYDKAKQYNADVVQCRFIYDFPNGTQVLPKGVFDKEMFLEGKLLKKAYIKMMTGINMNHVCMKLIRTSLIKDIRFDVTMPTAEDLDFCVRLFNNVKRYCFTPKVMYHYFRHEESLTGKSLSFTTRLKANKKVSKQMKRSLPIWNVDTAFYRFLASMRPYIIIVSKAFRILRERSISKRIGEQ